jgi:UDP-N-acetylmuramate: L-alanyl-gamma-D-glutamyl-meso-diaminopimelate ligase
MGCWPPVETFSIHDESADWYARALNDTASSFEIRHLQQSVHIDWSGIGDYNMGNALAAVAAACQTGIPLTQACAALSSFRFPNKRLQQHPSKTGFTLFEDFAHHPTAIEKTLKALRRAYPQKRLLALLEMRSNTMRMGVHRETLAPALLPADIAIIVSEDDSQESIDTQAHPCLERVHSSAECLKRIEPILDKNDVVVVLSNGNFDGLVSKLTLLSARLTR